MNNPQRRMLVTSALPYANGELHLGHMLEHIQSDIWVRFQKLRGHRCYFVCASDAHGTPIMLSAEKAGITPEELVAGFAAAFVVDFESFGIEYDHYHSTHSEENRELVESIYRVLDDNGHIARRMVSQSYDEQKKMFLPDRYVRGECPRCGTPDQYGDSCESCGATYSPSELINPVSVVSGTAPVQRESEHLFFKLDDFRDMLKDWVSNSRMSASVVNKLNEWFEAGLRDWDISRDEPYFGFEIPGEPGKYFYVWLDAPVGYMASFQYLCTRDGIDFDEYWDPGSSAEVYHFIGKDIIYFHSLFWPAVLQGSGYRPPSAVLPHGFLTVNGQKMSKSRGTFITAATFAEFVNPEYLRYYFAGKLGSGIDDIDLNLDDLTQRVNSDLVGKVVNIASRCAGFIHRVADGQLAATLPDPALFDQFSGASEEIATAFEDREYARAMRAIMALADQANRYIDEQKPWVIAKQDNSDEQVRAICTQGLNHFRQLCVYLKPVLPKLVANAEAFLQCGELTWTDAAAPLLDHSIGKFVPLAQRIEAADVQRIVDASRSDLEQSDAPAHRTGEG